MGLCKYCCKVDFREIALIGSGSGKEEWTLEREENDWFSCYVEHHKDLAEFEECALSPSGCDLCRLFFASLGRHKEDLHYDSESVQSLVEEDAIEKAKQFLRFRPALTGCPLYVGPDKMQLAYHRDCPGIGLWVEKDIDDWSITSDAENGTWHLLSSLKFFLKRDSMPPDSDPLVKHIWMRDIQETSRAPECIDIARRWLRNCLENHPLCQTAGGLTDLLPTRVIDVGSEHRDPRLVVTNGSRGTYVALSYCWGSDKSKHMMLTGEVMSNFQKNMPLSSFPGTLQDAVLMTRELGIRFLWIDALCIIQDSTKDWMNEAAKMNEVYSNSTVTLFATTSSSSDDGFFGERILNPECSLPCTPLPNRNGDLPEYAEPEVLFVRFYDDVVHQLDSSMEELSEPWTTRGWTLQERLSPARGITFTKVQMHWHCLMGTEYEHGSRDDVDSGRRDSIIEHMTDVIGSSLLMKIAERWCTITRMRSSAFRGVSEQHYGELTIMLWYQLVAFFQERCLTYQSDRLPAVAGLAKILENCLEGKDRYWAGLWESDWAMAFCWRAVPEFDHPDSRKDTHLQQNQGTPQAPSWSWASIVTGGNRSWIRGEEIGKGNFTTRSLMVLQPPADIADEERFVPTKPIVLRITAPAKNLSPDWTCTSGSTENLDLVQAAFERWLRIHLYIESRSSTAHDSYEGRTRKLRKRSEFAQKHKPHSGQKYLAIQILERTPLDLDLVNTDDTWNPFRSEIFFLILESEPYSHRRYRRVAEIRLIEEHPSLEKRYLIMEREGTKIYEGNLLPMVRKQQWQVEEIELV